MENHEIYWNKKRWWGGEPTLQRIVNQKEIVAYLQKNPGATERQIQEEVYGYVRGVSNKSNKKYADCLRRALNSGKLFRLKMKVDDTYNWSNKAVYCYFVNYTISID